jgi:hypothetical protein
MRWGIKSIVNNGDAENEKRGVSGKKFIWCDVLIK